MCVSPAAPVRQAPAVSRGMLRGAPGAGRAAAAVTVVVPLSQAEVTSTLAKRPQHWSQPDEALRERNDCPDTGREGAKKGREALAGLKQ